MAKYIVGSEITHMDCWVHHCGLMSFLENNGFDEAYYFLQPLEGMSAEDIFALAPSWMLKDIEERTGITCAEELDAAVKAHEFLCVEWAGGDKYKVLLVKGTNVVSTLGIFDSYEHAVEDALSLAAV